MPRQQADPAFAPNERLFRYLRNDWVDGNGSATEEAVDLQGTSVDREMFVADPAALLMGAPPNIAAMGTITFSDIPDQFEAPAKPSDKPPTPYESVVVYKPERGNDAHSEIQFWRRGDSEPSKPKSPALKSLIRGCIAERMRVTHRR